MYQVSVVPLVMSTRTIHPNSCGISPVHHMCWTISTRHIQRWGSLSLLQGMPPLSTV